MSKVYNIGQQRYRDQKITVCDKDSIPLLTGYLFQHYDRPRPLVLNIRGCILFIHLIKILISPGFVLHWQISYSYRFKTSTNLGVNKLIFKHFVFDLNKSLVSFECNSCYRKEDDIQFQKYQRGLAVVWVFPFSPVILNIFSSTRQNQRHGFVSS